MSKENLEAGLENEGTTAQATAETTVTDAVATEKPKRVKKVLTDEQILEVAKSVEIVKTIPGLSDNFIKLLAVVPQWTNAEANKAVKEEVAAEFGGLDKLKAYVADEAEGLAKDVAVLGGIKEIISTLGSVKSQYSRVSVPREKKGGKKVQVSIANKLYKVNAEFMQTLTSNTELTREEKIEKILAHASIEEVEAMEVL